MPPRRRSNSSPTRAWRANRSWPVGWAPTRSTTGEDILNAANVPTFKYPDRAARAFCYMWRYSQNLRALYETPLLGPESDDVATAHTRADAMLKAIRKQGRTILTEFESKQLLAAHGIPTVETLVATTEKEAVQHATRLGFPVVLKLYSETITHKTDVGGVQLNLRNATAVRRAWRAIESAVVEKAGKEHFLGVTGAADDQNRRLRVDHRQQH